MAVPRCRISDLLLREREECGGGKGRKGKGDRKGGVVKDEKGREGEGEEEREGEGRIAIP